MGVSALLAIRHAIAAAKKDLGEDPKAWFSLCKFTPANLGPLVRLICKQGIICFGL
jgi:hypothetical protein